MTTGVDAKTCKLIVLDQRIQSMTEFKQIIGRGTRLEEDYGKFFFTIMDFKQATELFADPDFDGDPVQIYEPQPGESPVPPENFNNSVQGDDDRQVSRKQQKFSDETNEQESLSKRYVVADVEVAVVLERVQYYGADGQLITESLKDYTRKMVNQEFSSLDDFLRRWSTAEKKQIVVNELAKNGVLFEALVAEVGRDCDPFDLICHIVWDVPPFTRQERAQEVKKRNYFTKYGEQAQLVLNALLDKYVNEGIEAIEDSQVLKIPPFNQMGTPKEIASLFGDKGGYLQALQELEAQLYQA